MSTAEVAVRRPQRWDTPFCETMTDEFVDGLLTLPPFRDMDASRFSRSCPLRGILKNDARLVKFQAGDIVVREGDYGNSAFMLLEGSVRVVLESLPKKLLGAATTRAANRKTYQTLHDLNDRMLKDIGLCRLDLFATRSSNNPRRNCRWQ